MKNYKFYFGSICVGLSLLPLVLLTNTNIIYEHFDKIVETLGGLMFATIVLIIFAMDDRCLSINEKLPLLDTETRKDFFTVPVMFIVFLVELVIVYLIDSNYVEKHFDTFTKLLGSMVFAFIIYAIFGGHYVVTKTTEVQNKKIKNKS